MQSTGAVKKTLCGKGVKSAKHISTHAVSEMPNTAVKRDGSGFSKSPKRAYPSAPLNKSDLKMVRPKLSSAAAYRGSPANTNKPVRTDISKLKLVQSKQALSVVGNKNNSRATYANATSNHSQTNSKIPALPCNDGRYSLFSCRAGSITKGNYDKKLTTKPCTTSDSNISSQITVLPRKQVKKLPEKSENVSYTSYSTTFGEKLAWSLKQLLANYQELSLIINDINLDMERVAQTISNTAVLSLTPAKSQMQASAKRWPEEIKNVSSALSLTGSANTGMLDEAGNYGSKCPSKAECPVCLENLMDRTKFAIMCGHVFCEDCISALPRIGRTCPVCRTEFTERSLILLHM